MTLFNSYEEWLEDQEERLGDDWADVNRERYAAELQDIENEAHWANLEGEYAAAERWAALSYPARVAEALAVAADMVVRGFGLPVLAFDDSDIPF